MWIICIKHHFHNPWGQRTQSVEFGRIGLSWKKPSMFDGPAVSTGWRRGDTSDNVPTHSVSLSWLAKSRRCHTPNEAWGGHRGVTLCQHPWEHFISTHQTTGKDWSEFSTATLSRGVLLISTPVRPQTPSFWLLSPLFGKYSLFIHYFEDSGFFWWSASGINPQKPVGLFLSRNYPRSNPCWLNPTAEPIKDRHCLKTTQPSSEQGFRSSKTKSPQHSLYE